LQQATIEHQVRFAKLHEKRAEVIAEVYERLVDAEQEGKRFVTVEGYPAGTDEEREARRQKARQRNQSTVYDLALFIEKRQIYLPTHVCASLKGHLDNMSNHVYGVGSYGTAEKQMEQQQVFSAACKAFSQDLPATRRALEDEFRRMLDVEKLPLPDRVP
jgi:hypothetical protein